MLACDVIGGKIAGFDLRPLSSPRTDRWPAHLALGVRTDHVRVRDDIPVQSRPVLRQAAIAWGVSQPCPAQFPPTPCDQAPRFGCLGKHSQGIVRYFRSQSQHVSAQSRLGWHRDLG